MKPFPPTLKEKVRYISFKMHAKMVFTENQVKHSIHFSVFSLLGELGVTDANFKIVEYNPETMSGIIRTTPKELDKVIAALTLIKDIQGKNAWCQVLGVSGTLKKCKEKYGYKPGFKEEKPVKIRLKKSAKDIMKYAKS